MHDQDDKSSGMSCGTGNDARLEKLYGTSVTSGLSSARVKELFTYYGKNVLPEKKPDSWFVIFVRQFQSPLIYILLVAAVIIFIFGHNTLDAFIVSGILTFNAIIGMVQEGRTSQLLAGLKKFITTEAVVVRDGVQVIVDASKLVPGDLILVQEGMRVPADISLTQSTGLRVDESVLTGESQPVMKDARRGIPEGSSITHDHATIFSGTYILAGSAQGIVTATGRQTHIGRIHTQARDIQTEFPLAKEFDRLSVLIVFSVLGVCLILLGVGIAAGRPYQELLVTLTALFICVVPEGLPVVLTLVLVSGVYRMARHHVLIKKMQAAETLGRADVIVIDKTGTLTRNELMVSDVCLRITRWHVTGQGYDVQPADVYRHDDLRGNAVRDETVDDGDALNLLGVAILLSSSAHVSRDTLGCATVKGDPTEAALGIFAQKLGLKMDAVQHQYTKIDEIPFDAQLKYHVVFCRHKEKCVAFITGAPETVLSCARNVPSYVHNTLTEYLQGGLRVVAVAQKYIDGAALPPTGAAMDSEVRLEMLKNLVKTDAEILGLCGIQDTLRLGVTRAIAQARKAGLRVIMATGDHRKTALHVATAVGIFSPGDGVIDGATFDEKDDRTLRYGIEKTTVYSRVRPSDKLKIIELLHSAGHVVAMTGDGVNDVPSLVAADIGIAMGRSGTEVAREAADMVLLDDSCAHIVTAIKQGRHIFYTLRRVVLYFFATNIGEVFIMIFSLVLCFFNHAIFLPLTAAQILWLNLVTDGFLDTALSREPEEPNLLDKSMITSGLHVIDGSVMAKALFMALPMTIGSLAVFALRYRENVAHARTMTLITMAMFQWFNAWNCKSETRSVFSRRSLRNNWFIAAAAFVFFLQMAVVYCWPLRSLFGTVPLSLRDWFIVCMTSSSVLILEELRKLIARACQKAP